MSKRDEHEPPLRDAREAKLAEALRANLRRRKASAQAPPKPKPRQISTD